ncbi:transcriptional repressor [Tenacibaculum caenipelagi]|uniref:Ferric uptake regulator family protein n=1 Tax=Tenacibaculum caenipelagi TaxID=1325435 RepID=A0A4R6TH63_9FLAO|nr:transcriptional repressor [Tenacibaculum caenipelagi]TDQ27642.1 ferric uptake regulator family protein [Tenacibaculum caenipelagi]
MSKLIEIRENKVFVDIGGEMKETNDCTLIGATVLKLVNQSKSSLFDKHKRSLDNYLENNSLRKTPEKYAILEKICEYERPFTSKELLYKMENTYRVSKATLYKTLKVFKECRIIKSDSVIYVNNSFKQVIFKLQN